jgi:Flp pilus assembly protein TadG
MKRPNLSKTVNEDGSSILETTLLMPFLVLLLMGAVDFGRAYFMAIEVSSAAEAGALYGTQNASDTAGMVTAATLDAPEVSNLAPVATYGCECSDGSSVSASCTSLPLCTYNVVNFVEVDTAATYTPIFPYPGIPTSIALTAKARMRAAN